MQQLEGHRSRFVEALEARRLLSAPIEIASIHGGLCGCPGCNAAAESLAAAMCQPPGPRLPETWDPSAFDNPPKFSVRIDFRPSSVADQVMSGYFNDNGRVFGTRPSGLRYGWDRDLSGNMRNRESPLAADDRYDTLVKVPAGATWQLEVANGWYEVRMFAGDPTAYDGKEYVYNVEGKLALNGKPVFDHRFVEGVLQVQVTDGKLTLQSSSEATDNALNFIEVKQIDAPKQYPLKDDLRWSEANLADSPIGRVESGTVRVGNKLFIMGGFTNGYQAVSSRVDIYDIAANKWSRGRDLPGSQTHAGVATDGKYIYWVAGQYGPMFSRQGTNEAWRYDIAANTWSRWNNLPEIRFAGAMAYSQGFLYFYGGTSTDRVTSTSRAWKIPTAAKSTDNWQRIADMPTAVDHHGHAVINGEIYSIGGERHHNVSYVQSSKVYVYNPKTNLWRRRADMPVASSHFEGAVTEHDGKIWIVAGQIDQQQLTDQVRVYDPVSNNWSVHTPLPEKRKGGVSFIYQDRLHYLTGDAFQNGQPRNILSTALPTR